MSSSIPQLPQLCLPSPAATQVTNWWVYPHPTMTETGQVQHCPGAHCNTTEISSYVVWKPWQTTCQRMIFHDLWLHIWSWTSQTCELFSTICQLISQLSLNIQSQCLVEHFPRLTGDACRLLYQAPSRPSPSTSGSFPLRRLRRARCHHFNHCLTGAKRKEWGNDPLILMAIAAYYGSFPYSVLSTSQLLSTVAISTQLPIGFARKLW